MGPEVSPEQWGWPESRGLRMVFAEVAGGLCMQPGAAKERFARSPHNCAQGLYLLLLSVTQGLETVLTVPHAPHRQSKAPQRGSHRKDLNPGPLPRSNAISSPDPTAQRNHDSAF